MKATILAALLLAGAGAAPAAAQEEPLRHEGGAAVDGWLSWRGPLQTGASLETGLFDELELGGENDLWTVELAGRGTPVIASGRLYTMGYESSGPDLEELVVCLDEKTGKRIWEERWSDFLSDSVYERYAIGSPTVDAETGNVYVCSTAGRLMAFTRDGAKLWEHSLMEEFGRMTFPNGRTGAAVIDGPLVIVHCISSHWGPVDGPARDRFYAFDKRDGRHVWSSTPGGPPVDGPYSYPVLEWRGGRRLLYAGTGCGYVVCVDALTGDPVWRFHMGTGGVCASTLLYKDSVIEVHGIENLDTSVIGRMVALKLGETPEAGKPGPVELGKDDELWRNDLVSFTSSPVLVGNRVYLTDQSGELTCTDADSGKVLWAHKLAPDQIHASPVAADGKLYVPMNNGSFYVVRPKDEGPEILSQVQLEGNALGAPAVCDGRVFVHTTKKLYCFGTGEGKYVGVAAEAAPGAAGAGARLQVVPGDVLMRPGDEVAYQVRLLDANGRLVSDDVPDVAFEPPAPLGLKYDSEKGTLFAPIDAKPGAATMKVSAGGLSATARIRVVPEPPYAIDFESTKLSQTHPGETPVAFEYPPSHWIGARLKWEVRELDGNKVLAKTLDNPLFQRSMAFFGHPDDANYTIRADVMTDGNRRTMSDAGVICQRYLIELRGNHQDLRVSSNVERLNVSAPFAWKPGEWVTILARVDRDEDGSGVVRAKAWKRGEDEPDAWTLEVPVEHCHASGSPGIYSLAPQSRFCVYLDNIAVTPNE